MAFTPKLLQQGAGGAGAAEKYIENLFSTYLYTGTATGYAGNEQNIINGIDVSGKGALIWIKARESTNAISAYWNKNQLYDTNRGITYTLHSDTTGAHFDATDSISTRADGFRLASGGSYYGQNFSGIDYVSWTFRKQPKFFDIVTWTGNGDAITVNHNLGSVPGCIIAKAFSSSPATGQNWLVYHRSIENLGRLNSTDAFIYSGISNVTSTSFEPSGTGSGYNVSGVQYIGYVFAHDAGGFGLTGTDNVISCGTYTGTGSPLNVTLGYEPQWVLVKKTSATGDWILMDTMRGMSMTTSQWLYPNIASAGEDASGTQLNPTATGFTVSSTGSGLNGGGATYIYIAIRKGPMKVPTVGTSVFSPEVQTPGGGFSIAAANSGFPIDWLPTRQKGVVTNWYQTSRLTNNYMSPNTTAAEAAYTYGFDLMQGVRAEWSTNTTVSYAFRRAPGFFDVVCVTPSYPTPVTHNLGAVPKLRIEKPRNSVAEWKVLYYDGTTDEYELALNSTRAAQIQSGRPGLPTATTFISYWDGTPIVAYLFAPVTGVQYISKFTGNGSSQTINCGFTNGARFVCIKAFSTTGDWKVIDTARGIIAGNDPTLAFNTTSAEVTNTDCIDPDSSGFIVIQETTNNLNVKGVEYLVWGIA